MARKQTRPFSHHVRHHVKLVLVPHAANQFRPHAVRRRGLLLAFAFILLLQFGYNFVSNGSVLGDKAVLTSPQLLQKTNQSRQKEGLPPLAFSDALSRAAYLKAKDMLAKNYWAHTSPNGTPPWYWLDEVGYHYNVAGENLAKGFTTDALVISAWLASSSHRANMLSNDYTETGFAVVSGQLEGRSTTLVVALYASPAGVAGTKTFNESWQLGAGNPLTTFGLALQSVSPAALGAVAVLLVLAIIALAAHAYRHRLPTALRQSWYKHHGAYKAFGLVALGVVFILASSSVGQI